MACAANRLKFEGMPHLRLLACLIVLLAGCRVARAGDDPDFAVRADALVAPYARSGIFSGTVVVAREGHILFRRAYGLANREWDLANTPETRFRIGSLTKQFTAAAVLRLVEAGRLGLDDPVCAHVPGLPVSWATMTIRMLLNHTSGLPNVTALPDYITRTARLDRTPLETVSLLFGEDLLFQPGSGYEYSNTGYILLAALIERITGRPFVDHLNHVLLAPAGLAPMADGDALLPRRASGYHRADGAWRNAMPLAASVPSGAGGLWATADDLVAWDRALLSGRVLSSASRATMFADGGHGYGLGWYVGNAYGRRLWSHGGFLNGFAAIKDTYPDADLTIVVLGNTETAPAQALSRRLAALVFEAVPDTQLSVSDAVLARYAGFYRIAPRSVLGLTLEGGRLIASITGRGRIALSPESDRVFAGEGDTRIAFDIEPDGRPTGALLDEGGLVRSGPRIEPAMARRITARRIGRLTIP